jgi:dTDP-4-amino-4,6-dideoxygalactose transaminase
MQTQRHRLVERYVEGLRGSDALELPICQPEVGHAWHLFVIRVRPEVLTISRDEVIRQLNAAGVGTSVHFIPLHEHSYYRTLLATDPKDLPIATDAAARIISLPLFSRMQAEDVDYIVDVLVDILRRHRR